MPRRARPQLLESTELKKMSNSKVSHYGFRGGIQLFESDNASSMLSQSILEHMKNALVILRDDSNGLKIVLSNHRFAELFGLSSQTHELVSLSEASFGDQLEAVVRSSLDADDSMDELEFSYTPDDPADEKRHFLVSVSRIDLPDSGKGILATFDEITEWKKRQSQVMEASRLVSIGEMAAGIAHEINNPLAAVMGFAQLAMRRDVDETVQKDLDKILTQAKRASKIIANLQSFARRYKPKKEPVHVVDILDKVLDFRSYEMQVSNIALVKNIEPRIPLIMGDEHQLDKAFLNIIINAEQSMTEARGAGTLTIDVRRIDDKVRVSISDDGVGLAEETISKIFDPFFTTRDVGQGTGLGLSVCYGIIHEHDGTITVESKPDEGAEFIVDLPIGDIGPDMPIDEAFFDEFRGKLKILIVDDEPAVAEFLSRALTDSGHSVDVHDRGEDVIQKSDLDQYDLMILDVRMPGVDGEALFEHVRRLYANAPPKILFITGDTSNPSTKAFVDSTGSPALMKPFTLEHLMSAIKRLG